MLQTRGLNHQCLPKQVLKRENRENLLVGGYGYKTRLRAIRTGSITLVE